MYFHIIFSFIYISKKYKQRYIILLNMPLYFQILLLYLLLLLLFYIDLIYYHLWI